MFNCDIMRLDVVATSQDELFQVIADHLQKLGYVTTAYLKAITDRETVFPTGLNTSTCGLALPHTDSDYIMQEGIAFVRLKQPVRFKEMVTNEPVDVKLLFFLLVKNKAEQVKVLSDLVGKFSNTVFLSALLTAQDQAEVLGILEEGN